MKRILLLILAVGLVGCESEKAERRYMVAKMDRLSLYMTVDSLAIKVDSLEARISNWEYLLYGDRVPEPLVLGERKLRIISPVAISSTQTPGEKVLTGEIQNLGNADAIEVMVEVRARNSQGVALAEYAKRFGTVRAGATDFFLVNLSDSTSLAHPMFDKLSYAITYMDSGTVRLGGSGTVVIDNEVPRDSR